jgi:hypothetical protein
MMNDIEWEIIGHAPTPSASQTTRPQSNYIQSQNRASAMPWLAGHKQQVIDPANRR